MDTLFAAVCGTGSGCDTPGVWLGVVLTLLVLSYLLKDTFLFRLAQSLLVGTAIGFGSAIVLKTVVWDQVLLPTVTNPQGNLLTLVFVLIPGLLLLTKLWPNWAGADFGNWPLGLLFGVGAALAISGAINGALVPQLSATIVSLSPLAGAANLINSLVILIGTVGALLAFRFTRSAGLYDRLAVAWGRLGRGFIMIAFGALFTSVLTSRIAVLVSQLYFILHDALGLVK